MLCLNILCRCPQFPACLLQCVLIPTDPGASPWSPSCKISSYFVIWLAERLLLRHGLMLTCPTLLSSEPLPWEAVGGENPRAGTRKSDISEQDHSGDQPLSSSFTGQCWGGPHMLPAPHPTNPSCFKGGIFRKLMVPMATWHPAPSSPHGCRAVGYLRQDSPCHAVSAQGDGVTAEQEGVSPLGASLRCACSKPFPCTQCNRGAGTEGYAGRATPAPPVQSLQPLWAQLPGEDGACENCAFSSHLQTVMMVKSGLFFIRERLLLGHPGP